MAERPGFQPIVCWTHMWLIVRTIRPSWQGVLLRHGRWPGQWYGRLNSTNKKQYDKRAKPVTYQEGTRVMVFMPKEARSKNRKLALPYHGPYRVLEVRQNCLLVQPVDRPDDEPILVNMDRVVECSEELPNTSWLGKQRHRSRQRCGRKSHRYSLRN